MLLQYCRFKETSRFSCSSSWVSYGSTTHLSNWSAIIFALLLHALNPPHAKSPFNVPNPTVIASQLYNYTSTLDVDWKTIFTKVTYFATDFLILEKVFFLSIFPN